MYPINVTVTGTAASTPIIPDIYQDPFNIGIGITITTGAATWAVEHCFDWATVMNPTWNGSSNVTWFQNSGLGGTTAPNLTTAGVSWTVANGNYAFPVAAIRLNVYQAANATTTVVMNLIQASFSP